MFPLPRIHILKNTLPLPPLSEAPTFTEVAVASEEHVVLDHPFSDQSFRRCQCRSHSLPRTQSVGAQSSVDDIGPSISSEKFSTGSRVTVANSETKTLLSLFFSTYSAPTSHSHMSWAPFDADLRACNFATFTFYDFAGSISPCVCYLLLTTGGNVCAQVFKSLLLGTVTLSSCLLCRSF